MRSRRRGFRKTFLILLFLNVTLGGVTTEYVVEYWTPKITGKPIDVKFWPCAAVGLLLGEITIPAAAVTWMIDSSE